MAFPPRTRGVQFDEKWSFVGKKQKNRDPAANPANMHRGDWWDHVADDPEHRLVLVVVPGTRSIENAEAVVAAPRLMTSDEQPAYASAIEAACCIRHHHGAIGNRSKFDHPLWFWSA